MKTLSLCGCLLLLSVTAQATTLTWDRGPEADLDHYTVYGCFTPGCVVTKSATLVVGAVFQSAVGVRPQLVFPQSSGTVAVSATDGAKNESDLSIPLKFPDGVAPGMPGNFKVQ